MRITNLLIPTALLLSAASLAACGDDEASADPVTHDEWFDAFCARMADAGDPGFDAFFAAHPEPTTDDWAEFLPGVVTMMDDLYEAAVETPAAPEDEERIEAAAAAIKVVRDNFADAAAAAAAGDAEELARLEEKNQGTDVPAMEAAMGAVETRDCPSGEG